MKNKILLLTIACVLVISSLCFIASANISYCCEKTTSGAWCQNAPQSECDDNYAKTPASCEATSYCKLGCCFASDEGTCMENSPKKACENENGVWGEGADCNIPQCSLGCCLIGDQAAFVTQTRCTRLSSIYGLEAIFKTDIDNEFTCIASAFSSVKGACIYEEDYTKNCLFVSQKECNQLEESHENVSFYADNLCSNPSFGTNCGKSKITTCVEGTDEVYFKDTCGNLANIYNSKLVDEPSYWTNVVSKAKSCGTDSVDGNADSATCGNCDYFLGSTCKEYKRGTDKVSPNVGDYICRDLGCEFEGETYKHGETWCADSKGIDKGLPGSRHFRMVCYDNEVSVEPCADFRQEVCLESDINGFRVAACRANRWQDCHTQSDRQDCENTDKRDCKWLSDKCVPELTPGFNFWDSEGDASSVCSRASTQCVVNYNKKLGKDWEIISGSECLASSWAEQQNQICSSLGDCGSSVNYLGAKGYVDVSSMLNKGTSPS